MRIEFKGYVITQLTDGRYYASKPGRRGEFIVENLDDALDVIAGAEAMQAQGA